MAITTDFNTGFEYGLASVNGTGLFDSLNAACTITSTGGEVRNGTYAGKLTYAAAAITFNKTAADQTKTKGVIRVAFKVITTPTSGNIAGVYVTRRVDSATILAEVNSSGQIQVQHTSGSIVTGPTVNDSAWHVLEMQFDSGTAGTLDWRVDGVLQTQATGTTTSSNIASWRCGSFRTTTAGTIVVDDWISGFWTTSSDWYGDGKGTALLPGSDGTHSFTANDFSTGDAGTQRAPSYTDFYTMVDDAPPWSTTRSTTDNIAQRVVRTTGYVEIRPASASSTELPANAIRALMAYSSSATQANKMATIVRNSAGTATVLWGDLPTAQGGNNGALEDYSESNNFFKSGLVAVPAAGWTNTEINAVHFRVGGSDDISPVPTIQNLMLEVDYPTLALSQTEAAFYDDGTESGSSVLDSGADSITRDVTSDSNIQLRLRLQETKGVTLYSTDDYQLQYELNDSGTWVPSDTVVDSYSEANQSTSVGLNNTSGNKKVGQTFTGNGSLVTSCKFYLSKNAGNIGNIRAIIYSITGTHGTNGSPTGTALAISDDVDVSTLGTSLGLVTFTFSGANQIILSNATNYCIEVENLNPSSIANVSVGIDTATLSHGGNYFSYLAGGGAYSTSNGTTRDVVFYVYGISAIGPAVIGYNSASLTDGNATTNRLGSGSGSFVAGEISEDGLVDNLSITGSNYTELLYSLTLVSSALANADTLDFRVLRNGLTTGMTYTVTPRITVSKSGGGSLSVSVSDSITISESTVIFTDILYRSVSDSVIVTESRKQELESFVNKSDSVTLTENVSITLPLSVNVSDSATISENTKVELNSFVNKSDSISVTESTSLLIPELFVNKNDSITITESTKLLQESFINKSDSITLTESSIARLESYVNKSDSVTITENVVTQVDLSVVVSDSATITESTSVEVITLSGDTLSVSVSDSITVSENRSLLLQSFVSVNDSVTLTESIERLLISFIASSDSVTITENVARLLTSFVNKSDSVSLTESVGIYQASYDVSVSDSVTASESVSVVIDLPNTPQITVEDGVTITEATTLLIPSLFINVNDPVVVTENHQSRLAVTINSSDTVTLAELSIVNISNNVSVYDQVTITENKIVDLISQLAVSETVTLTESISLALSTPVTLNIAVSDLVAISEYKKVFIEGTPIIRGPNVILLTDGKVAVKLGNNLYMPL